MPKPIVFFIFLISWLNAQQKVLAAEISRVDCNIAVIGTIERSDPLAFRAALEEGLRSGCGSPTVHVYSPGGNLDAALDIAEQVYSLQLKVSAPLLLDLIGEELDKARSKPRDGARRCEFIPGFKQRLEQESLVSEAVAAEIREAMKRGADFSDLPKFPRRTGDFDPATSFGDPRCTCASACFFIWAAGAERLGDVLLIHRPYFERSEYSQLDAGAARQKYEEMAASSAAALQRYGIPRSIIDRMFGVESSTAAYLSADEVHSLRMAPHWSELKISKCGAEPKLEEFSDEPDNWVPPSAEAKAMFGALDAQQRRWLLASAKRESCWRKAQQEARKVLVARYLRTSGN